MNYKNKFILKLLAVLTIVVFLIRLLDKHEVIDKSNLSQLEIKLSTDIKVFKGTRYSYFYKFWGTNYSSEFVVDAENLFKNDKNLVQNLKKGNSILIFIKRNKLNDLYKKTKRIRVFQILKGNKEYLKID